MITDPFNTADTYYDEMPHHLADHCEHAGVGKACRRCRRKFDAASQWARDYLSEQGPTDAEVEAAARALYAEDVNESYIEWPAYDSPLNVGRELYIERARNALSAARAVRRGEEKRNGCR